MEAKKNVSIYIAPLRPKTQRCLEDGYILSCVKQCIMNYDDEAPFRTCTTTDVTLIVVITSQHCNNINIQIGTEKSGPPCSLWTYLRKLFLNDDFILVT